MKINSVAPSTVYNNQYSTEKTKEAVADNDAIKDETKKAVSKLNTTVEETTKTGPNKGSNINIYA